MFPNLVEHALSTFIWPYLGCTLLTKRNEHKYKPEKFSPTTYKRSGLGVNGLGLGRYLTLRKIKYHRKKQPRGDLVVPFPVKQSDYLPPGLTIYNLFRGPH